MQERWEQDGYAVLRGTVDRDALAGYAASLTDVRDGLLVRAPGDEHVALATQREGGGAIDPYAISDAARAVLLPDGLLSFLDWVPLLFDAAEAAAGAPEDGAYRDATFTALAERPEALVTVAVAMGSAGVALHPGSAAIATTPFSGRYAHFNAERDGDAALDRHREELLSSLGDAEDFALEPGDVAVWSAGVVHRPVTGAALVAHLCPSDIAPGWFAYRPERALCASYRDGAAWLTSQHYDLVDAVEPGASPIGATRADDEELRRVEDALEHHDEELATPPPPPDEQQRRAGGLVGSVRGILGRRGRR